MSKFKFFQIQRKKNKCKSVKASDYGVDLQSKNNFRWLFIVILEHNVRRLKVYL